MTEASFRSVAAALTFFPTTGTVSARAFWESGLSNLLFTPPLSRGC
jgi:hypothetical protein